MKTYRNNSLFTLIIISLMSVMLSGCSLFDKDDPSPMVPDNWFDQSYKGTLTVRFTNVYPEWDKTATMQVEIEKELGTISFTETNLFYSGETLVSPDSKIVRKGNWNIFPTGVLDDQDSTVRINVDAHVVVNNDVQQIYAKSDAGNWILVNETNFGSVPNSDLSFVLNDAVINGSVVSASSDLGSLTWTLRLTPTLD